MSAGDSAKITGQYPGSCLVRSYIFFQLYFSSGGGAPPPAMILAGRSQRRNPCEVRSSLSQFPLRGASLPPTGQKTATRSSYADVRFVNGIRSLVTDGAASRHTTSITIGLISAAAAVPVAGRPLPSCRGFRCLTPTTVYWLVARHCGGALRSTIPGNRPRRHSKTQTACPIPPRFAVGRVAWSVPSQRFLFSARRLLASFTG